MYLPVPNATLWRCMEQYFSVGSPRAPECPQVVRKGSVSRVDSTPLYFDAVFLQVLSF